MLLSMWNIYHALGFDDMVPMIGDGRPTAHDVRLIASSYLEDSKIYVGHANDFFESREGDVLVVHRRDMIMIRNADLADVFDELCSVVERFDAWERDLAALACRASSLQEMLDASDAVIGAPLFLYGPDGGALALSSAYGSETHDHWGGLLRDRGLTDAGMRFLRDEIDLPTVFMDRKPTRRPGTPMEGLADYIHCSLFPHGRMAAHLVCFGFGGELPWQTENLLATLARAATSHMEAYFSQYNPLSKLESALRDLLEGGPFREREMRGLARSLRWSLDDEFRISCVVEIEAVETKGRSPVLLPGAAKMLEGLYPDDAVIAFSDVVVLVQRASSDIDIPKCPGGCALGVGDRFRGLGASRAFFLQARHEAHRARLSALDGGATCSSPEEHRREELAAFSAAGVADPLAGAYVPGYLRDLQEHDRANGSDYYQTLRAYVLSGFHPAMAAQLLGVHRNSFAYRMERMRELADISEIDAIAASPAMADLDYLRAALLAADVLA